MAPGANPWFVSERHTLNLLDRGLQAIEMGWFDLPEHREEGVATEAARLVVTQARADPDVCAIHAYPAVTNTAANAITRKIA